MDYNVIGIDPSLISTGMCVNGKLFNYAKESNATTKKGLKKWFKLCEDSVTYRLFQYKDTKDLSYADTEMQKLQDYNRTTDLVVLDILATIDKTKPSVVGIEGFSFGSASGNALIDLVTFSTLLRIKLFKNVTENIIVMSPSTLKVESAKMSYEIKLEGSGKNKKETAYNHEGMKGGSFTKREMFLAIVDNQVWDDDYIKILRDNKADILSNKKIDKPLEDCNDAKLLFYYVSTIYNK